MILNPSNSFQIINPSCYSIARLSSSSYASRSDNLLSQKRMKDEYLINDDKQDITTRKEHNKVVESQEKSKLNNQPQLSETNRNKKMFSNFLGYLGKATKQVKEDLETIQNREALMISAAKKSKEDLIIQENELLEKYRTEEQKIFKEITDLQAEITRSKEKLLVRINK